MVFSIRTAFFWVLAALFALLPFHTFLVTGIKQLFFDPLGAPPAWISAWKELLLLLFIGGTGILMLLKKIPRPRLDHLDVAIILYVVWSLATGFWRWGADFERTLWGAKYSLFFLGFFMAVRHFPLEERLRRKLFTFMLGAGAVVVLFGVLQKFLPEDFLVHFGYSPYFSDFHPDGPISYCQKISFTEVCRLQSFLSGPNQLGAYLLLILPFFLLAAFLPSGPDKEAPRRALNATLLVLGLFALFFAYSRAAWAGILLIFTVAFWLTFRRQKWFRPLVIGSILCGILALSAAFFSIPRPYATTCAPYAHFQSNTQLEHDGVITSFFCQIVYRPSSSQSHFERSRDGIRHILMHPLGTGLGDSGPASARFYKNGIGFIPESWYLQVGIDTGWPGLILFLSILFLTGKKLLQTRSYEGQALFCGLIGISLIALKLHAWESADVAYTFWGAAGLALGAGKTGIWNRFKEFLYRLRQRI